MSNLDLYVAEVYLGEQRVGYLSHYQDGKNIFTFDEAYLEAGQERLTLSLSFNDLNNESITQKRLQKNYQSMHALPIFFSNLLPEGGLRDFIINCLKLSSEDEFKILMYLSHDLPGNLNLKFRGYLPEKLRDLNEKAMHEPKVLEKNRALQFSLAGVQVKFSMLQEAEHFTIPMKDQLGDFIVKTPSIIHPNLPETEYSMMLMAQAIGVSIPDIKLVKMNCLQGLPALNLPKEQYAYAIRRFDRVEGNVKIHMEDFAQILSIRPRRKYDAANYETLAKIIMNYSMHPSEDLEQFMIRLIAHTLLGNTDAHLKNWSLYYPDGRQPRLSPAYDIISSLSYIDNHEVALNMARYKDFYRMDQTVWHHFARRVGLAHSEMDRIIKQVVGLANEKWPILINTLPISSSVKKALQLHWQRLPLPLKLLS